MEAKLPDFPYGPVVSTVTAEAGSVFEPLIRSGKVDELADKKQVAGLKASLGISAADYLKAMRIRSEMKHACSRTWTFCSRPRDIARPRDYLSRSTRARRAHPLRQCLA